MVGAIILGIIAGYVGRAITPGRQEFGFILTAALGILGSVVGYLIFTELLGIGDTQAFDLGGLFGSIIGVVVVLFIYNRIVRSRPEHSGTRSID